MLIVSFIAACSNNVPSPIPNLEPSEIRDPEVGEEYEQLSTQIENTYNCDGASPTTIFQRSLEQEQTTVFAVEVEAGGLIRGTPIPTVLEVELETKLKSALQRYQGLTYKTSVEQPLSTPNGQALRHTIIWREKWVKGIIEVLYQDKAATISFQRIVGFQLEGRTSEPLACEDVIVPENVSTLPAPTQPEYPPTPEIPANTITVWAIEENGIRVDIQNSGIYMLSYLGDAYSPWPNEQEQGYQGWTTIVRVYVNRPVEWGQTEYGLNGPINQDAYLGPGGYYLDKNDAIMASNGDSRTLRLNAGDYLTLVVLDEQGRYFDNKGKVDVQITFVGQ
jgi:hypothetical protein